MHRLSGNANPPAEGHTDPDYAPTVEVFDNLSHADIQRGVLELNPEVLTVGRQAWQSSAAGLADAVQSAHNEIRGAIADGWRGGAAQLAADAVAAFEQLGLQLSDVMAVVGHRLGQANDAAETLRAAVSQQVTADPDLEAALLDPKRATTNIALQKTAENLRQDAVRVMDSVYAGVFLPTGDNVPAFPDGSMYPNPAVMQPGPDSPTAPGGGSADLVGRATAARVAPAVPPAPAADPAPAPPADRPAAGPSAPGTDAEQPVVAPAATAPVAVVPASAPPASVTTVAAVATTPGPAVTVVANPVGPHERSAAPGPTAAPPPVTGPAMATVLPAAASAGSPTGPAQTSESGKRDEHEQDRNSGADSISGMGAGIVGGLAGGAFAAGDAVRSGPSGAVAVKAVRRNDDDEDEDYYPEFDEPTFLEPADPGGELVGQLDPTTPPVLGEWSEDD
ncbi:PPE domain-containing protein [Nocardia veterana]|uniref:PPE domain-containing protein n=2 Tax=Nocardia veterana TaxID=132249 RepID=A0A7X6RHV9_9NOCA|nr:hypothetical protein [Nocardia veterana]NKY85973.1 hypothetical protein [Nocardia veterana]